MMGQNYVYSASIGFLYNKLRACDTNNSTLRLVYEMWNYDKESEDNYILARRKIRK